MKLYISLIFSLLTILVIWYPGFGQITATTEQRFYSIRISDGSGITEENMLQLDLKKIFGVSGSSDQLKGGIIADAQGGFVSVDIWTYDEKHQQNVILYSCHSESSSNEYIENPTILDDNLDPDRSYLSYLFFVKEWKSTDIKASALNRGLVSQYLTGSISYIKKRIPIYVKVTIRNATLKKFKLPVLGEFDAADFFRLQDTKRRFFSPISHPNYVSYVSHRGDKRQYPENSPQAIQAAINMGADMVEIDLDTTKDGVILGIHIGELGRYATGTGFLKDKNYETDVKNKIFPIDRLGRAWDGTNGTQKINLATLEELLLLCKGKVMVHMDKCDQYIDKVVAISDKLGMTQDLVFKGRFTPTELYTKYSNRPPVSVFGLPITHINYFPIFFADGLSAWQTKLNLGSNGTWQQVFDAFLNDFRINKAIKGFELNWFSEYKPNDLAMLNAIAYVKSKNKHIASFSTSPESFQGWWNPNPAVNDWRRFNPYTDRRSNWDFWFDGAEPTANPRKPYPTMVFDDNTQQVMKYLTDRGLRQ